jgi:hypothetical protein
MVKPWELEVAFKQGECPTRIVYKYSIRDDKQDTTVWEREPSRFLEIKDPSLYSTEKGDFIVNGQLSKVDANFVGGLTFDKIGETNIFIGPYP